MVSCCRLLGVRSFALEVRSWSGNHVPINLYQTNVILHPDKKGQGPRAQISPSKVPFLAERRPELSWQLHQGQVPTPCPAVLPKGARHLIQLPLGLLQLPKWGETRVHRLWPRQTATGSGSQRRGGGEVRRSSRPGPWLVEGLSQSSGAPQDTVPSVPWPPGSATGSRLGELEGLQEKAWLCLLTHSPPADRLSTSPWAESLPPGARTVSYQWAGALQHWPRAEQDNALTTDQGLSQACCPVTGCLKTKAQQWLCPLCSVTRPVAFCAVYLLSVLPLPTLTSGGRFSTVRSPPSRNRPRQLPAALCWSAARTFSSYRSSSRRKGTATTCTSLSSASRGQVGQSGLAFSVDSRFGGSQVLLQKCR